MTDTGAAANKKEAGFAAELVATLRRYSYRDPFYDAVRNGRMSRQGVKLWTLQARLVVAQFTRFISAIHSNCPDRDAQQLLAENLWEEHGAGIRARDHLALAERMARSLGATEAEMVRTEALPETVGYIDHCLRVTRLGSFVEGLTAIGIGIEHQIPAYFGALAEGLRRHYGMSDEDLEYLMVHVEEDASHAGRSLELIEKYATSEEIRERAMRALVDMLEIKRRFAEALFAHCSNVETRSLSG